MKEQLELYKQIGKLDGKTIINKKHSQADTMDREKDNNVSKKITPNLKNASKQKSAAVSNNNETSQKFVAEKRTKVPVVQTNTSEDQTTWRTVERNKGNKKISRQKGIIGKQTEIKSIQVVPKKGFIYVSRLAPQTKAEDICNLLRPMFPEVQCTKLDTKYPDYYSAFKVMVDLFNFNDVMDANIWPVGTYVSRYFHKSNSRKETT